MKIIVFGYLLIYHYKLYKQTRTDPATDDVPVAELLYEHTVDGGAGNLVRNIESLCDTEVQFFYSGCLDEPGWINYPTKVRYYVDDTFVLREDKDDKVEHDSDVVKACLDCIESDDFVILSDYHKGSLRLSDIESIKDYCKSKGATLFVDTNHIWEVHHDVDWLKVNLKTAHALTKPEWPEADTRFVAKEVSEITNSNVIVTTGKEGCVSYMKGLQQTVVVYKDKDKRFVDSIGAGDTFLAGFVSYFMKHRLGEIPALLYADVVSHLSVLQTGTIDVVPREEANEIHKNARTFIKEGENNVLWVHRFIDNV